MGFLPILALGIGAATTISQQRQARKAARAQREASDISSASQQVQDRVARRRAIRESRIQRAMIQNSAAQSGGQGSSGEIGALSALGSNLASGLANQRSQQQAAQGISAANQKAADAESAFNRIGAYGKLAQQGLQLWSDWKQ